jgi:hypothetical protein
MDRRIYLAYFVGCATPALPLAIIGFFGPHNAGNVLGQSLALAIIFSIFGGITALPIAVPLIIIGFYNRCLHFWTSTLGGGITGTIVLFIWYLHQSKLHPDTATTHNLIINCLSGFGLGVICGLGFAWTLKSTGFFIDQRVTNEPLPPLNRRFSPTYTPKQYRD